MDVPGLEKIAVEFRAGELPLLEEVEIQRQRLRLSPEALHGLIQRREMADIGIAPGLAEPVLEGEGERAGPALDEDGGRLRLAGLLELRNSAAERRAVEHRVEQY